MAYVIDSSYLFSLVFFFFFSKTLLGSSHYIEVILALLKSLILWDKYNMQVFPSSSWEVYQMQLEDLNFPKCIIEYFFLLPGCLIHWFKNLY